jgi:hypothetical protein
MGEGLWVEGRGYMGEGGGLRVYGSRVEGTLMRFKRKKALKCPRDSSCGPGWDTKIRPPALLCAW